MKLTTADKRFVQENLKKYLKATKQPPGGRLVERAQRWAVDGYSMSEIAEQEGVSTAAVSQSIVTLVDAIRRWE